MTYTQAKILYEILIENRDCNRSQNKQDADNQEFPQRAWRLVANMKSIFESILHWQIHTSLSRKSLSRVPRDENTFA